MTTMSLPQLHDLGLAALIPDSISHEQLTMLPKSMNKLAQISLGQILQLFANKSVLSLNGAAKTAAEIKRELNVADRHHWLIDRWLIALNERGMLEQHEQGFVVTESPQHVDVKTVLPIHYRGLGFPESMAAAHLRVLASLAELLSDQLDISQVLFQQSSPLEALAAYQTNYFTRYLNQALAHYLKAQLKPGPMLKVLELGGGTGLLTEAIFKQIAGRPVQYQFTDISTLFIQPMQTKLKAKIGARCRALDINHSFTEQNVTAASLNYIVAGNVLHNAQHLGDTLKYIRQALKVGGQLLFTESIADNPVMLTAMQFLLSPSAGQAMLGQQDCRASNGQVFIDDNAWQSQLAEAGLRLDFRLPEPNSPLNNAGQALFITTAV